MGRAVRAVPGGEAALGAMKRTLGAARGFARPPRPPLETPNRIAALSRAPAGDAFITGNGFAARCRYVLNFDELKVNEGIENDWWFCKADFLEYFFRKLMPDTAFVLFSHNSARTITRRFARRLRDARLVAWFAQNPAFEHPKLRAIPVGIPNPKWASGETAAIERVQREAPPKSNLFDVTFDVGTNPKERMRCVAATGLEPAPRRPFEDYLRGLASSHFCLSPPGKGIDAVRTWEALYLRTVPVVRRSVLTDQHPDLPWIVLDDWSQFKTIEFTPALYEQVWAGWDPARIRLDRYLKRVEAAIAELRLER